MTDDIAPLRAWLAQWQDAVRAQDFEAGRALCAPEVFGFGGISGDQGWVAAPWDSRGLRPGGTDFERPGRATIIFTHRDGRWLATHTHFSLAPFH